MSISSNISEGTGREHIKEFNQFLSIALGSLAELDTQLIISEKISFRSNPISIKLQDELKNIRKMIIGL